MKLFDFIGNYWYSNKKDLLITFSVIAIIELFYATIKKEAVELLIWLPMSFVLLISMSFFFVLLFYGGEFK